MSIDHRSITVDGMTPMMETIRIIDEGSLQVALVVDDAGRLLGTVTDGDVRRALLRGLTLESPVSAIMNASPITIGADVSRHEALALMRECQIRHVPRIDDCERLIGLEVLDAILETEELPNWVVLMAGGLGTRLRPLTEDLPKPLLPVGGRPLLETIMDSFVAQGFRRFFLSVNYQADKFKAHFGDGSDRGIRIAYVEEPSALGTAGALGLLPERPRNPLVVMNGDLLTSVNFRQLLDFHAEHRSAATMCVREYSVEVPFGVAATDQHRLTGIEEKPVHNVFVNAGIYVLDPRALGEVRRGERLDMPALFKALIAAGDMVTVFPVHEYWLDIGRFDDLHRAESEFSGVFRA